MAINPEWNPDTEQTVIRTRPAGKPQRRWGHDWRHALVLMQGADAGRRFEVGSVPVLLGRRNGADIQVLENEVSSQHCQVHAVEGRDTLVVTDLNSTNGSFVNGRRISQRALLPPGGLLQVGNHVFRHDHEPSDMATAASEADRELERASHYVMSLLPPPIDNGAVRTDWVFKPSSRLGGDAFGYQAIDEHRFAGYLIDVCGHGAGAAMHAVSAINVLRQRALPDTDFGSPAQVLQRLNAMFQMDAHAGLYFTAWYAVYDQRDRSLVHAGAGHHAGFLRHADGRLETLSTRNPMIGPLPVVSFTEGRTTAPPGSVLYAFSDGVYEIVDRAGRAWGLADFSALLAEPPLPGLSEPERLHRRVSAEAAQLDDDFSLVTVTFLT